MSGHNKWSTIRHKKGAADAKRGKVFTKLIKEITVAAKIGGGDANGNPRLRAAIDKAKAENMPKDNIERAIKKGIGEIDGGNVEETLYEGYGPSGVAIMCDIMTDNRNRTAPEIRKIFDVHGGSLGGTGCVAYIFERKGIIALSLEGKSEEQIIELAMENEALDVERHDDRIQITTAPECLSQVATALEQAGMELEVNEVVRIPQTTVDIDADSAQTVLKLLEALEDHDDVQAVSTNLNFQHPPVAQLLT